MTLNDRKASSHLIKNGKYFLPPPKDGSNLKELFQRLAAAGAGRSVDEDGFPNGPWTPELLADAISQLDANHAGIELRTVQRWFQHNETGISTDNIRWLARVFGCGDPEATSEWQAELSAANWRLSEIRKENRKAVKQQAQSVRRQGFWVQRQRKLRESSAHLVGLIMRRVVCDASAVLRVSFV